MNTSVVILAAGAGTRIKSKTPKVLHTISGYPLLYHIIKQAQTISNDINIVLYHDNKMIKDEISKHFTNLKFHIQDHQNFPGTGGAIKNINFQNEKVLVLCGDMPLVQKEDLEMFLGHEEDAVMSVFKTPNPKGYGRVLMDESDHVLKIVEEKDANEDEKLVQSVNAGVYLFDKACITKLLPKLKNDNAQKEYYITDLISLANENGLKVKAIYVNEERFMGINTKAQLATAETLMQRCIKENLMNEGVLMRLPETIYIDARAKISGECVIENGVSILGESVIENSIIKTNSVVEDSVIKNSDIGPMARIRPQSEILDTHIGNFVEVKKSTLKGVKAGHLSYLGDAEIDEGTNVGCGTITCNYDGVSKHKTIIGKNVFIGSDTQLVAPVSVEDNVLIAAGTTVTKNLNSGVLAINRAPLKQVDGYYERHFGKKDETSEK